VKLYNPNAFHVLALVRDIFYQTGQRDRWPEVEARMKSGNYRHLCAVAKEVTYGSVEVVDDPDDAD